MNKKPIMIIVGVLILAAFIFLITKNRLTAQPQKNDAANFLEQFNTALKNGTVDTLVNYIDGDRGNNQLKKLLNILANHGSLNGVSAPLFKVNLLTDKAEIRILNPELTEASIPVEFTGEGEDKKTSVIVLQLRKDGNGQLKVIRIDARRFFSNYLVYENNIKRKNLPDTVLFSPITLQSFAMATKLKARYDSVIWFEHINDKTFFYVVKGDYKSNDFENKKVNIHAYKMGLVNPELKEIIPVKYDLIHNIGGTIDGLIEVENEDKKGFFDVNGKEVVPVDYDSVIPLSDEENIALLSKGEDNFYLKKDFTISERLTNFKIADIFKNVKNYGNSFIIDEKASTSIMEYNDKDNSSTLVITPSYLVQWDILPKYLELPNHLRKSPDNGEMVEDGYLWYKVDFNGNKPDEKNWFESAFYSIINNYVGSRSGLYESKNILVIDKRDNKILSFSADSYHGQAEGGGELSGTCNENSFRQINDTLFEFKTTSMLDVPLYDKKILDEGPYYHYLTIRRGKLVALPNVRTFGFTRYIKMDNSYLNGCYTVNHKYLDHMNTDLLQYAKNEIFAQYHYKFTNSNWTDAFQDYFDRYNATLYMSVQDSLTAIDKYNINWINQKLKEQQPNTLAYK